MWVKTLCSTLPPTHTHSLSKGFYKFTLLQTVWELQMIVTELLWGLNETMCKAFSQCLPYLAAGRASPQTLTLSRQVLGRVWWSAWGRGGGRQQWSDSWLRWWLRRSSVCLQCGRPGFDPWVGKIPWWRKWQSTPVLLPGKSHGQRSLVGYSPWGRRVGHDWATSLSLSSRCHLHSHIQEATWHVQVVTPGRGGQIGVAPLPGADSLEREGDWNPAPHVR